MVKPDSRPAKKTAPRPAPRQDVIKPSASSIQYQALEERVIYLESTIDSQNKLIEQHHDRLVALEDRINSLSTNISTRIDALGKHTTTKAAIVQYMRDHNMMGNEE